MHVDIAWPDVDTVLPDMDSSPLDLAFGRYFWLTLALGYTGLASHLDLLLSTHTFGYPKEDQRLWEAVQAHTGLNPEHTLFIDDSEPVRDASVRFGIDDCLGVTHPDSGMAEKVHQRHAARNDYRRLIPSMPVR